MDEDNTRPLVAICMATYNQEKYVRDSVRGLLSQTYEPLEIVISDDHSTDRTWDIINEEVDAYKANGGIHKNIVLNRNEKNLGVAKHSEVIGSFIHGELSVGTGGDDICLPNRVERIVEEWVKDGKRAAAISHSGYTIDTEGRWIGIVRPSSLECPLGAVMAWKRFGGCRFPCVDCAGGSEDVIGAARAMMRGGELILPDKLLLYRIGSGVTSTAKKQREPSIRGMVGWYKAYPQVFSDLEYLRTSLGEQRYAEFYKKFSEDREYVAHYIELLTAESFGKRYRAYKKVLARNRRVKQRLLICLYLLPRSVGDFLLNIGTRCKIGIKRLKCCLAWQQKGNW